MEVHIPYLWLWFTGCLVLFVVCTIFMSRQSKHFKYLRGVAITSFSIFDLEFPGTISSIRRIITGIQGLDTGLREKSLRSLKANLRLDFLFMTGVYPGIFLLCMNMALRMERAGKTLFLVLAWLQALAFLFDILENIYLFNKVKNPTDSRTWVYRGYRYIVGAKWVFATSGAVCALFGLLYFWINGNYGHGFLVFGLCLLGLLVLLILLAAYRLFQGIFDNDAEKPGTQNA